MHLVPSRAHVYDGEVELNEGIEFRLFSFSLQCSTELGDEEENNRDYITWQDDDEVEQDEGYDDDNELAVAWMKIVKGTKIKDDDDKGDDSISNNDYSEENHEVAVDFYHSDDRNDDDEDHGDQKSRTVKISISVWAYAF